MRQLPKANLSLALLMSLSIGLGACAAHQRSSVSAIRATRDAKNQQAAIDAKRAALVAGAKMVDISSLISADNKGTYQLSDYSLKINKMTSLNAVSTIAQTSLESSQMTNTLPNTGPVDFITVTILDPTVSLTDVWAKIPSVVNEFSATDGSVLTSRKDSIALKDGSTTQYQETITLATASDKVSDTDAFSVIPVVKMMVNGQVLITRSVTLDAAKGLFTQEQLVYTPFKR